MAKAPLAEPISAFEFEMHWQIATDCGKTEQNYACCDCDPLVPFVQLTLQDLLPTLTTFAVRLPTCDTYCKLAQRDCTQTASFHVLMQVTCNNSLASVCHNARTRSVFRQPPLFRKGVSKSVSENLHRSGRHICARTASARRAQISSVTQPSSCNDVDRDLWTVLDLASDEELEGVHDILFGESRLSISTTISHDKEASLLGYISALADTLEAGRLNV